MFPELKLNFYFIFQRKRVNLIKVHDLENCKLYKCKNIVRREDFENIV